MNNSKKLFLITLIVMMLLGYFFALMQIYSASGFGIDSIFNHFLGNEEEMIPGMSFRELTSLSHIHMSSMTFVIIPSAYAFVNFVKVSGLKKNIIILSGFVGVIFDIISWWGLVYIGKFFVIFLFLGGTLYGFSLITMSVFSIYYLLKLE